jgi:hypothetical protein
MLKVRLGEVILDKDIYNHPTYWRVFQREAKELGVKDNELDSCVGKGSCFAPIPHHSLNH